MGHPKKLRRKVQKPQVSRQVRRADLSYTGHGNGYDAVVVRTARKRALPLIMWS